MYNVSLDDLTRFFKGQGAKPTTEELKIVLTALFFRVKKGSLPLVKKSSQRAARRMREGGVHRSLSNKVLFRSFHGTPPKYTWSEALKALIVNFEGAGRIITEQLPRVITGGAVLGGTVLIGAGLNQHHERTLQRDRQRHEQNLELFRERREQFQEHNRLGLEIHERIRDECRHETPDEVYMANISRILERSQEEYDNMGPFFSSLEDPGAPSEPIGNFVLQNIPQVRGVHVEGDGESKEDLESTTDSLELKSIYEPGWFDTDRNSLLEDILSIFSNI